MPNDTPSPSAAQCQDWQVQCVSDDAGLALLAADWLDLESHCPGHSPFATYAYVSLAWKHSQNPEERLLILVVRQGGVARAIAPFRVSRQSFRGIPARVVTYLAEWEGDRPGPLCGPDAAICWQYIERFFAEDFHAWDLLSLREQEQPIDSVGRLAKVSFVETEPDSLGYYISLDGDFESYLAGINAKVRTNWRNRSKKVEALDPPATIDRIDTPDAMLAAVGRFVALERTSWKADAGLGMGKDKHHLNFYADYTATLAREGQVAFFFLRQGERDLAGSLLFMVGNTVFERHIANDPEFAPISPGIMLRTRIMEQLFKRKWRTFDLMGMHPSIGRQRHKADWATGQWEAATQRYYRKRGRLAPIIIARRIRDWLRGPVAWVLKSVMPKRATSRLSGEAD